jgi:stearoyl-CoA desaturase (Delta-9 desaturase)
MNSEIRKRINWKTSIFLFGTLLATVIGVPIYLWHYDLTWLQGGMFLFLFSACCMSITLGYHRLYAHRAFAAHWSVRLATLLFGAAAFENSVLLWASEHRRHHKHVDHEDEDPYAISRGFFYAHMGWLLMRLDPAPPFDNVADLKKEKLVMWQHNNIYLLGFVFGFIAPAILGYVIDGGWVGALGGFLIGGVARTVAVQHVTFCINSLCHTVGSQPYSNKSSARDSFLMAIFTFGEGYHNYHHTFQYDYRNGVKPWQWDPTKWAIWLLNKIGLARDLRRVDAEKIKSAEAIEKARRLGQAVTETVDEIVEEVKGAVEEVKGAVGEAVDAVTQRDAKATA